MIDAISQRVIACERCPELRAYCAEVARIKKRAYAGQAYWGKPVPAFGDPHARVALVGLAPGAHGSNRTGRMFTGDASGNWLYRALFRAGFANQPNAVDANDGLRLRDAIVTAAGRCAPPGNKPTPVQLQRCFPYLAEELAALTRLRVVVGLGAIGTRAAARALEAAGYRVERAPFSHGAERRARHGTRAEIVLLASYHPSRQNTNTGVLTEPMLDAIFARARALLSEQGPSGPARNGAPNATLP